MMSPTPSDESSPKPPFAVGQRNVVVGRDVINSIINTGDHNQFFTGHYVRLRDAYIKPAEVFERVNLARFMGREWLLAEVDAFLRNHDRGYFILEAAAGLGKTTFLAWLTQERGYIHHFCELVFEWEGIEPGLKNLAAQLIVAYHLDPYEAEGVVSSELARPDSLFSLLKLAADQRRSGEKIVLVVDALDQAGTRSGQKGSWLPSVLPEGVYFIVSQRPVGGIFRPEKPLYVYPLEAEAEVNLADMRAYLVTATTWPGVARALAAPQRLPDDRAYTAGEFVETLLRKCRGVWIYLHYVVNEIERGERSMLDLASLPNDVWRYYAQDWGHRREQDEATWYSESLPLLSTLAAAQEALTLPQLCALSGVINRPGLESLLQERWRPYLSVERAKDNYRYRLYHTSLYEFLAGQVDRTPLPEADRSLAEELAEATRQAHSRIADRYIAVWGGLEAGLPGLRDPEQRDLDAGYGLRHMVAHLEEAGRADDLHRLLRVEWVQTEIEEVPYTRGGPGGRLDRLQGRQHIQHQQQYRYENVWYTAKERVGDIAGYQADLMRAWRSVENTLINLPVGDLGTVEWGKGIALQCRYASILATLNSLSKNMPPALLAALLEKEIWTAAQGLAYARQTPDVEQRAEALVRLGPHMQEALAGETLTAAQAVKNEWWRAIALVGLSFHLAEPRRGDALWGALEAARALQGAKDRARTLAELSRLLPETERRHILQEALMAARDIEKVDDRAQVLTWLIPHPNLSAEEHGQIVRSALDAAREMHGKQDQAWTLVRLLPHLPETERKQILEDALAAVRGIKQADERLRTLVGLVGQVPEEMRGKILAEALIAARAINPKDRSLALGALASQQPAAARGQTLREALAAARAIRLDEHGRAQALAALIPLLPEVQRGRIVQEALGVTRAMNNMSERPRVLARLALHLPQGEREQILQEALEEARKLPEGKQGLMERLVVTRAEALLELLPSMPESKQDQVLREALAAAQAIRDEEDQARALAGLAPQLPKALLEDALVATRAIKIEDERVRILSELAPHLSEHERAQALREALATTRGMKNEGERAWMLAWLAPYLPAQERERVQQESITALRSITNVDKRSKIWGRLHHYLPEPLKSKIVRKAISEGMRAMEGTTYLSRTLAELALHSPEPTLGQIWQTLVATGNMIRKGAGKVMPTGTLSPYQPDFVLWISPYVMVRLASRLPKQGSKIDQEMGLWAALLAVREIEDDGYRAEALVELAPHLPLAWMREIVEVALAIENNDERAWALAKLASHYQVREKLLPDVLAAAREIRNVYWRAEALVSLAPFLSQPIKDETMQDILASIGTSEETPISVEVSEEPGKQTFPQSNPRLRRLLGRLLPQLAKVGYSKKALALARMIENTYDRAWVLAQMAPALVELPSDTLVNLWQETLPILATRTRRNLLSDLRALAPVIAALGGPTAAGETFRAIQDVGRWWP